MDSVRKWEREKKKNERTDNWGEREKRTLEMGVIAIMM